VHLTIEVASLWEKISWWVKFSNNWSKKKVRLAPWMEQGTQNLLAQIGSHGVLWIPSTTNLFPLSGGYGVVQKVRIKKFNHILNTIEMVGKTSKMDEKQEARKQQLGKPWHACANIQVSSNSLPST
jgi:hypothetical protein